MKLTNISEELNLKYGERGTEPRERFEEESYSYYNSEMLKHARKEAGLTQKEVADRVGTSRTFISDVEIL